MSGNLDSSIIGSALYALQRGKETPLHREYIIEAIKAVLPMRTHIKKLLTKLPKNHDDAFCKNADHEAALRVFLHFAREWL